MKTQWGIWGMLLATSIGLVGCVASPTTRKSQNLWDMNYMARSGSVVEPKPIRMIRRTDPVPHRTGAVGVWTHPKDTRRSLIIGTDVSRQGAVLVFDLGGRLKQKIPGLRLPYGMAITTGFDFGRRSIDIAVTAEADTNRLRIFGINPTKQRLWEVTGETSILAGREGADARPTGVVLHRDSAGRTLALVSRKSNLDEGGIIHMYELKAREGRVNATLIRDFGAFSGRGMVETMLVDDHHGALFYFDSIQGVRRYQIIPKSPSEKEESSFGKGGWEKGCTGMALLPQERPGFGYLMMLDRQATRTGVRFFRREGAVDDPTLHLDLAMRATLETTEAYGFANSPQPMPKFPEGLVVVGNHRTMTYDYYSWRDLRTQFGSPTRRR